MRCKFCKSDPHNAQCPRDLPRAEELYKLGWDDGNRALDPTSNNPAYMAGWHQGDIDDDDYQRARDAANGCDYY